MGECCGGYACGSETPRQFLTREEKIEMLREYKETLEKEVQGIAERIKELEKR